MCGIRTGEVAVVEAFAATQAASRCVKGYSRNEHQVYFGGGDNIGMLVYHPVGRSGRHPSTGREQPTRSMTFREYTGKESLQKGAYNIPEPHNGRVISPSEIDLMLVPGVAFDTSGGRLGRGKGFYDRYLSRLDAAHIYKVGICLPHQLVAQVPTEPHDVRMDTVIIGRE
jgi:hypothetical protein